MSKGLEALERYGYHCNHYVNGKEDYKIIETALKALEIIKKYVNVDEDENGLYWLNLIGCASIGITQEEFNLLKEVLV